MTAKSCSFGSGYGTGCCHLALLDISLWWLLLDYFVKSNRDGKGDRDYDHDADFRNGASTQALSPEWVEVFSRRLRMSRRLGR